MRRTTIEAEINFSYYKKLAERLKKFTRKDFLLLFDRYIYHIMDNDHAEELLKILDAMDGTPSQDEKIAAMAFADDGEDGFTLPQSVDPKAVPEKKYNFTSLITAGDLESNRDRLNLQYDVTYFSYLHPDIVPENAKRLIAFASDEDLPVAPHWRLFAASPEMSFAGEEEGGD